MPDLASISRAWELVGSSRVAVSASTHSSSVQWDDLSSSRVLRRTDGVYQLPIRSTQQAGKVSDPSTRDIGAMTIDLATPIDRP
jgi:hypothetical protein